MPPEVMATATPDLQAQRLGVALRARRKALGVNMAAAAEAAGISRVTWHRLEKGEARVAWGSLLAAAAVVGLELEWAKPSDGAAAQASAPSLAAWLPLRIRLADYPGLRSLAWQLREGLETLAPREALGLYERNWRHLDEAMLTAHEWALVRALRATFDGADAVV